MSQVEIINPAGFVREPTFACAFGKTSIVSPNETRRLIRAIPTDTLVGLGDGALIGLYLRPRLPSA